MLIVDDEPDILLLLRIALDAAGFDTALAADGDVALQRLRRERFDVVLLDIRMPVLDGWGVLESLQGDDGAPPVIVVSAHVTPSDQERLDRLGAVDLVTKPFESEDLCRRINVALAGRNGKPAPDGKEQS